MIRRARGETNLIRLLKQCEIMAMDTENIQNNWRLEKYAQDLGEMLVYIKSSPRPPDKSVLLQYEQRIEFVRGIIRNSKLSTVGEKAVASELMVSPASNLNNSPASGPLSNQTMEIKHRHKTKYSEDLRKELFEGSGSSQKDEKPENFDELVKYHHDMQEKIAEHMVELTRSLKDQATAAGQIIKNDTEVLERSSKLIDVNQATLKVESEKLEMYNKSACKCWVWVLLFIVCAVFICMVLFMRLFKKRVMPS